LHEPQFEFYLLATLVMNNLQHCTDLAIIQPGVAILSLLTTRVSQVDLIERREIRKFVGII
jgi:hypothetical protein